MEGIWNDCIQNHLIQNHSEYLDPVAIGNERKVLKERLPILGLLNLI